MKSILKVLGGVLVIGFILMLFMEGDFLGMKQKKAEQAVEKTVTEQSIRLVDGELGEYGKEITIQSETLGEYLYVWYQVPAGTYTAISEKDGRVTIFVVGDESSEDVRSTQYLNEYGSSVEIVVEEGSHIELSGGAKLLLNPKV